jgi:hypothetical protein
MNFIKNPAFILRVIISMAYVALGISLLVNPHTMLFLSGGVKVAFSLLLIAYGIFRAYRAWEQFKSDEL